MARHCVKYAKGRRGKRSGGKLSWRAKRKGKHCKHGFRKHSAKCLKRPRRRR